MNNLLKSIELNYKYLKFLIEEYMNKKIFFLSIILCAQTIFSVPNTLSEIIQSKYSQLPKEMCQKALLMTESISHGLLASIYSLYLLTTPDIEDLGPAGIITVISLYNLYSRQQENIQIKLLHMIADPKCKDIVIKKVREKCGLPQTTTFVEGKVVFKNSTNYERLIAIANDMQKSDTTDKVKKLLKWTIAPSIFMYFLIYNMNKNRRLASWKAKSSAMITYLFTSFIRSFYNNKIAKTQYAAVYSSKLPATVKEQVEDISQFINAILSTVE